MERFAETLSEAAREAGESALDRLRAIGRAYVRFAARNPAHFSIVTRFELINREDAAFDASYQATFDMVKDAVCAAQREGWRRDMDPTALVISCWSAVHGLATLYLDGVLEDRVGPVDLETAAEQVTVVVISG
jgi:AcrR family transcriptional regulator